MDKLPPELINMILEYLNIEEIGICLDTHRMFNVVNSDTTYKIKLSQETLFIAVFSQHDSDGGRPLIISKIHTTLKKAVEDLVQLTLSNEITPYYNWDDCQRKPQYYRDCGGYRQFIYQCTQAPTLESSIQWMVEHIDTTNVDTIIKSLRYQFELLYGCFDDYWSIDINKTTITM